MKSAMLKLAILSLSLFLGASVAGAAILTVGPTGEYATPCPAIKAASPGDTIQIDYNNGIPYQEPPDPTEGDRSDCVWYTNNLTIVGVNGRAILDATGETIQKGILNPRGAGAVISNLELRNSTNGNNAAAIRVDAGTTNSPSGGDLTVEDCYIHDNEDGILTQAVGPGSAGEGSPDPAADGAYLSANPYFTFEYDEFSHNGVNGSGLTHNMYIGGDTSGALVFTLEYSWSHDDFIGHTVKTRGPNNNILYNLITDQLGATSYLIDFPMGGTTYVVGNSFYKTQTTNGSANRGWMLWRDVADDGIGDPEYSVPYEDLHFVNNTVVLDPSSDTSAYVVVSCQNANAANCPTPAYGPVLSVNAVVENNIFVGPTSEVVNQSTAVASNNLVEANNAANLAALFVDWTHFNFHLVSGAAAIGTGLYPPTDNTGAADPKALAAYEYVMPISDVARPTPTGSTMDEGAYSYPRVDTPPTPSLSYTESVTTPGTGTITLTGLPTPPAGQYNNAVFISENTAVIPAISSASSTTGTITATFTAVASAGGTTVIPIDIYVDGAYLTASVTVVPGSVALQSITLDRTYYPETTIHLTNPSTSPVVVTLTTTDPSILAVPASVTIPAGATSAETGSETGSLWGQTPPSQTATIGATYDGNTQTLPVTVDAPKVNHFYCNVYDPGCDVVGGNTVDFIVAVAGDMPAGGGPVTFTSDTPAVIPNQTFQSPAGNFYTDFYLITNSVTTSTNVTISISVNGSTKTPLQVVTVNPGTGTVTIATSSGFGQTAAVGTNFPSPLVVLVKDASSGAAVSGATVTFAGTSVSFPAGATAVTTSSGQAQVTAQPTGIGALTITASVSGASAPATFTETGTAGAPASVAAVSGSGQSSAVGTSFASPLVVIVKDSGGNPVSSATVTFAGTGVSFPAGATAVTNSSGDAQVTARPTASGALTITATVAGVSTPASFSETGTGAAASVAAVSGSGQSATSGTPFANPLVVIVKDASNDPVPGTTVTFAGSNVSFPAGATAVTNSSGDAQVTAQPTTSGALTITATVAGVSTPASFSETGTAAPTLKSITLIGSGPGTTVHLKAAATSPVVITLSSSNPSVLSAPATVTVPTGASSVVTGTLLGSLWAPADSAQTATLTATLSGATKTLAVTLYSPSLHSFACQPASCPAVVGGQPYNFTLQLSGTAPVGGGTVQITSDTPAVIPNQIVAIPAGQSAPTASPISINTSSVTATTTVNVTATFNKAAISVGPITVNPVTEVKSVTSDGGSSPGTTVNLTTAAPTGGLVVQISSSDPATAYAPATVTVPAGQTSAEIGTLLGSLFGPAGTSQTATISASYNSVTKTLAKTYTSPSINAFGCPTTPCPTVIGGKSTSFNLALSRSGAPVGGATIQITSDTPAAIPNQTVQIAAGQASPATIPVLIDTNMVTANTVVHLTASYNGSTHNTTGGAITVTPQSAPASIAVVSGSGQSAVQANNFANPLVVVVEDANGNTLAKETVTFAGTGVSFPAGATAVTNSSGEAQVMAQPTTIGALTVTATVAGVSTPASFSETGDALALSSITLDNKYQSGTTVHLNAAAPTGGVVVDLSTSDPTIEYVPATVTVPAGATSAETGSLLGSLWGQTPSKKTVTITGTYNGVTQTLTTPIDTAEIHNISCNQSGGCTVVGGNQISIYFQNAFNVAPYGGATVQFTSSNPAVIPNQTFTLAAGQGNAYFNLNTSAVSATTTVDVTLNYNGIAWGLVFTVNP